jgi:hypothetical protein
MESILESILEELRAIRGLLELQQPSSEAFQRTLCEIIVQASPSVSDELLRRHSKSSA